MGRTVRQLLVIAAAAVSVCASTHGQDDPPVSAKDVARWVAQLGDDDFNVREAASKRLIAAGRPAVGALVKAAPGDDAEVTFRAVAILKQMALGRDAATFRAAMGGLRRLARSTHNLAAERARAALSAVGTQRRDRAIAYLQPRGASITVNKPDDTIIARIDQSWKGKDEDLAYLQDLVGLNWLSLEHSPVTDAGIEHIARLDEVEKLYLGHSAVKGNTLALLKGMSKLNYLSLDGVRAVGDQQVKQLADVRQLEHLGLDDTSVTDAGLVHLKKLTNLKTLWLDGSNVTAQGLERITHLTELQTLNLLRLNLKGSGLKHLKKLSKLRTLSLQDATVDRTVLDELATLDQLRTLTLKGTNGIDDTAVARLKQALPNCDINR